MPPLLTPAQKYAARDFLQHILTGGLGPGRPPAGGQRPERQQAGQARRAGRAAGLRRRALKIRLYYERLRLGSDVVSPYLYKKGLSGRQTGLLPRLLPLPLTIGQWLELLARLDKKM